MESTEEQRCLCLKPGTQGKMKEAEQGHRLPLKGAAEEPRLHPSLTSPIPLTKIPPFPPAGMMLAAAAGGFCSRSLTEQEVMLFLACF